MAILLENYGSSRGRPMDALEVAQCLGVSLQQVYKMAPTIGGYFRIGKAWATRRAQGWVENSWRRSFETGTP
jgi:non-ribosomal peptide synthetase component E (peptide arylation enzyme)